MHATKEEPSSIDTHHGMRERRIFALTLLVLLRRLVRRDLILHRGKLGQCIEGSKPLVKMGEVCNLRCRSFHYVDDDVFVIT